MARLFLYDTLLQNYPNFDIKVWENADGPSGDVMAFHLDVTDKDGARQTSTYLFDRPSAISEAAFQQTIASLTKFQFITEDEDPTDRERQAHGCIRLIASLHYHFPKEAAEKSVPYIAALNHIDPDVGVIAAKLAYDHDRGEVACDLSSAFQSTRHSIN